MLLYAQLITPTLISLANICWFYLFDRGVCEACRQTGQYDIISHQLQQQRGDGIHQHFTGNPFLFEELIIM